MQQERWLERVAARYRRGVLAPAVLIVSGIALSACGGRPATTTAQLHLACETVECECRATDVGLFEKTRTAPIVWSARGEAGCPAGYRLWRIEKDILGNRK